MTAPTVHRDVSVPTRHARWDRRWWAIAIVTLIVWAVAKAGLDPRALFNADGMSQVRAFFAAMVSPKLTPDFLELTVRAAAVTLGYALVGTALALVIGFVGGIAMTERIWSTLSGRLAAGRVGWSIMRFSFAVPRSLHEVVFGLILLNILGLNPLVAILAIGIPFGAVTAKVFSELLDEVPRDAELALRASGASRLIALLLATVPQAMGDLLSYGFYRFECSLRSAAVLGIVGAGGLGFELALSFQSLRYDEMWTLLWALIILSGLADYWSSTVRRRRLETAVEIRKTADHDASGYEPGIPPHTHEAKRDRVLVASAVVAALAVPVAYVLLDVDITSLWDARARRLGGELLAEAFPPQIGVGGLRGLVEDALDTVALAVLAIGLAWVIVSPLAFLARRPNPGQMQPSWRRGVQRFCAATLRFAFLMSRSIPPPVWAFVVVFVVFPGLWPAAIALAIYNAGILGRLQGEILENNDPRPAAVLAASGASASGAQTFATVPAVSGRFVALGLYRWEVAIRETVIVGAVGAAGLGRRLDEQTSSFDYDGILATIIALIIVTVSVDLFSAAVRRSIR